MENRNINIDIIKTLALLLVIGVHFFLYSGYYQLDYNFFDIFFIILRNITVVCVPIFIITTGFLNKNKIWSKRYYLNIVYVYVIYSCIVFLLTLNDSNFVLNYHTLRTTIINILEYKYYGWYINMYVGLILIAPIINISFKYMEEKIRRLSIFNIIIAISLPITLFDFFSKLHYSLFANLFPNWWYGIWPIIYYIVGVYFSYQKEKIKFVWVILIGILLLGGISYYYFNLHFESVVYGNIFTVITAICIFNIILNYKLKLGKVSSNIIKFISNNTLIAYLLSYIVDINIYPYLINIVPRLRIRLLTFPVVVIMNFIITIVLTILVAVFLRMIKKTVMSLNTRRIN